MGKWHQLEKIELNLREKVGESCFLQPVKHENLCLLSPKI